MDSSSAMNHSDFQASDVRDEIFNGQDKEFLSVSEDLVAINDPLSSQNKIIKVTISEGEGRISGYFCWDTVLNLCHRVLTETEIQVLKKGFDYAPIQKEINEPVLRKIFLSFASVWEIGCIFGMNQLRSLMRYHVLKLSLRGNILMTVQSSKYF